MTMASFGRRRIVVAWAKKKHRMKVVILAGGLGSRLSEHTALKPKPMVEIGQYPILFHILNIYAAHGFDDFVIACGYKGEVIKEYFQGFHLRHTDFTVRLRDGELSTLKNDAPPWTVTLIDTGLSTMTGGRVRRLASVIGEETFMVTYGDGVGNVNITKLVAFHRSHGKAATVTAVRPPSRFGGLVVEGGRVREFTEKPQTGEGWINGGFFVFEPRVFSYLDGDESVLEKTPLERLARDGELMAFEHHDFWQPMDTLREKRVLDELWASGKAPWKILVMAPVLEFFRGRRVLVTGHTGFKGAWLCEWLLTLGANVVGFARPPDQEPSLFAATGLASRLVSVMGHVEDAEAVLSLFRTHRPELVLHLAAQALVRRSYQSPLDTYATNVMGTAHVLEAARKTPSVRSVVIVTSDKCYENVGLERGYVETDPMGGHDPYSSSKGAAELVTQGYRRSFFHEPGDAGVASARAGNVIGGGDWLTDRLVPDLVRGITRGEPVVIRNPDATRPFQHVLEPLYGYLVLARQAHEKPRLFSQGYNFGPRDGTLRVRDLAERFVATFGRGDIVLPPPDDAGPHEARTLSLDSAKAHRELDWTPRLDIADTVSLTASWYKAYYDDPRSARATTEAQIAEYMARQAAAGA